MRKAQQAQCISVSMSKDGVVSLNLHDDAGEVFARASMPGSSALGISRDIADCLLTFCCRETDTDSVAGHA